jgi:hypothetical protein
MQVFMTTNAPVKTKEQKKVSSLSVKVSKAARARHQSGPCVVVYKKD